jgi:hypothetical protein
VPLSWVSVRRSFGGILSNHWLKVWLTAAAFLSFSLASKVKRDSRSWAARMLSRLLLNMRRLVRAQAGIGNGLAYVFFRLTLVFGSYRRGV